MKVKLILKSVDALILFLYTKYIEKHLNKIVIQNKQRKRITLLKSPHAHKKAMEQFELITYRNVIIFNRVNIKKLIEFLIINKPKSIKLQLKFTK